MAVCLLSDRIARPPASCHPVPRLPSSTVAQQQQAPHALLVEAVQQFNEACGEISRRSRSVEHEDAQVDEVLLLRKAHERLRSRLRRKVLNDVADGLVGTAWWVVGDQVVGGGSSSLGPALP